MSAQSPVSQPSTDSSPFPSISPSPEPRSASSDQTGTGIRKSARDSAGGTEYGAASGSATPDPSSQSDSDNSNFQSGGDGLTGRLFRSRSRPPLAAIFIHAGAGFHSTSNEHVHLEACSEAARLAMQFLKSGGTAVDAVEVAIRSLEDKEITNAGYGSNLTIDGHVEGDATIVDHLGRSGACGATPMIKNPISLARLILDQTSVPLTLRRIPPNILVGLGARRFAEEHGMRTVPHEALVSRGANVRFCRWRQELYRAEIMAQNARNANRAARNTGSVASPPVAPVTMAGGTFAQPDTPNSSRGSQQSSSSYVTSQEERPVNGHKHGSWAQVAGKDAPSTKQPSLKRHDLDSAVWPSYTEPPQPKRLRSERDIRAIKEERDAANGVARRQSARSSGDGPAVAVPPAAIACTEGLPPMTDDGEEADEEDLITDTVGAIAVDFYGNIAAGSSSGGIGMKHSGRIGPAALVGVGTAVVPADPEDSSGTCVAAVTSGTGEHMATTMASHTCAERLYHNMRREAGGSHMTEYDEDNLMKSFVIDDFLNHPGVRNQVSGGSIGVMAVKKTRKGIYFYFAHNTDSFALGSMSSNDDDPLVVMSRMGSCESVARGGRKIKPN